MSVEKNEAGQSKKIHGWSKSTSLVCKVYKKEELRKKK